jgi:hypothetical protein
MTERLVENHPEPFRDDLVCLLEEVDWICARCRRLGAQRLLLDLEEEAGTATPPRNRRRIVRKLRRSIPVLRRTEEEKRRSIDARLALNRDGGPGLALDAIEDEYGLTPFERIVLLLGCLAAAGEEPAGVLDQIGSTTFFGGTLCVETCWNFAEMSVGDRLGSLPMFLPSGPLFRNGLVECSRPTVTPASLPGATIEVTPQAFARLTGIVEFEAIDPADSWPGQEMS